MGYATGSRNISYHRILFFFVFFLFSQIQEIREDDEWATPSMHLDRFGWRGTGFQPWIEVPCRRQSGRDVGQNQGSIASQESASPTGWTPLDKDGNPWTPTLPPIWVDGWTPPPNWVDKDS